MKVITGANIMDLLMERRQAYEDELSALTPEQRKAKIAADQKEVEAAYEKYLEKGGKRLTRIQVNI